MSTTESLTFVFLTSGRASFALTIALRCFLERKPRPFVNQPVSVPVAILDFPYSTLFFLKWQMFWVEVGASLEYTEQKRIEMNFYEIL